MSYSLRRNCSGYRKNLLKIIREFQVRAIKNWQLRQGPPQRGRSWHKHGTATGGLALGGKARIGLDPAGGAFAETHRGGSDTLAAMETISLVDSHLPVGDGFARHGRISAWSQRPSTLPARSGQHLLPGRELRRWPQPTVGLRPPSAWGHRPSRLTLTANLVVAHQWARALVGGG